MSALLGAETAVVPKHLATHHVHGACFRLASRLRLLLVHERTGGGSKQGDKIGVVKQTACPTLRLVSGDHLNPHEKIRTDNLPNPCMIAKRRLVLSLELGHLVLRVNEPARKESAVS